jgi:hypothetical protein
MQRREAKIGLRDRKRHRRLNERNDTCKNPRRNALSGAGPGIRGSVGLDGGRTRARTWDPLIKRLVFTTLFQWLRCKSSRFETQQDLPLPAPHHRERIVVTSEAVSIADPQALGVYDHAVGTR